MPDALSATANRSVLVLDADQPSALAITRALGRHGLQVHVASEQAHALAASSRHAAGALHYPDPLREEAAFIDWLAQLTHENRFGLIIPVTERTVVPILRQRQRLDDRRIAMAPSAALEQVLDKERTVQLARSLGVPVPKSITVDAHTNLSEAAAQIGFPVVIKPSRSVGQEGGQRVQLSVSYAHNLAELQAQVSHALRFGAVILQEYFRGQGLGIELIADQGSVRYAFQHRRLHEVPLTGGGSSLRISEAIVPSLLSASQRLIQALGWHGVAMVEFKYAPDTGEFRLMEINGRFWGSLPLAVAAGANFPVMLHELLTSGRVGDHAPARPGIVCRHLARDIDWLEHVMRRAAPAQLVQLPSTADVLRDSLLVLSPRHSFDVQSWRDPRPGLVDLWRIVHRLWARVTAIHTQRQRLKNEFQSGRRGGPAQRQIGQVRRVLFLCYGNINRSALAQAAAAARYPGPHEFSSAGFHTPAGRGADPVMVDTAAKCGIDLRHWQSNTLNATMVQQADMILAMEVAHLDRLVREHPDARGKAYLLGAAAAAGAADTEVPDPYGKPLAVYEKTCQQVLASLDGWFGRAPRN